MQWNTPKGPSTASTAFAECYLVGRPREPARSAPAQAAYEGKGGHQGHQQRGEGVHHVVWVLRPRAVGADGRQLGAEDEQRPERHHRKRRGICCPLMV